MRFISLLLMGFLCLAASPEGRAATSAEAISDGVKFVVSLEKDTFIEGEPILATYSIINTSSTARRLAEPSSYFDVVYGRVNPLDPNVKLIPMVLSLKDMVEDFGWLFEPGECHSEVLHLGTGYENVMNLPVGDYTIEAGYGASKQMTTVWQGQLSVKGLKFSVVKPDDEDALAARDYREAHRQFFKGQYKSAAALFRTLVNPAVGRRFAAYAGYWEATCYGYMGDTARSRKAWKEYADTHGSVPFFGRRAIQRVASDFQGSRDFQSARMYYNRLPIGFARKESLEACDRLEKTQKVTADH